MLKLTVLFLEHLRDLTLHVHLTLLEANSFLFTLFLTLQCILESRLNDFNVLSLLYEDRKG